MRLVVVGAEGRLGLQLLAGLRDDEYLGDMVSLVDQRAPAAVVRGVECRAVDLTGDLSEHFRFADAVLHAGGPVLDAAGGVAVQNYVANLQQVCDSVAKAGVTVLVCGCSAAAYRPARQAVDEVWPMRAAPTGWPLGPIVEVESLLEDFAADHPIVRVVRLRVGLVVGQPTTVPWATPPRRRWATALLGGRPLRVVPDLSDRSVQPVHIDDLRQAFRLALAGSVSGPFNIGGDSVDTAALARTFHARPVRIPLGIAARLSSIAERFGFLPSDLSGRLEMALESPPLDTGRARRDLGWEPRWSSGELLAAWRTIATSGGSPSGGSPEPGTDVSASTPPPDTDPWGLYELALEYFDRVVHSIEDDKWSAVMGDDGLTVLAAVSDAARSQYRIALLLQGVPADVAEVQIPDDPLGFHRADGWDLAAERLRLCLADPPVSSAQATHLRQRALDGISQIMTLGPRICGAIGSHPVPAPQLEVAIAERETDKSGWSGGASD